ncbi:MAG: hypothetical protein LUB61_07335, partial [Eggerthellaceae bacterium]|nr:hypothetical protein [Eggerthellaceae bacterium]
IYVNPLDNRSQGAIYSKVLGPDSIPGFDGMKNAVVPPENFPNAEVSTFQELLDRTENDVRFALEDLSDGFIAPNPRSANSCRFCPDLTCPDRLV